MRGLVQRVSQASVSVAGQTVGEIGAGLCVLVGVTHDDTEASARKLADKIWGLRVIDDDNGVMNRSVADIGGEVLVVSQFTLYGDTSGGRRPSWINAARPEHAARRGSTGRSPAARACRAAGTGRDRSAARLGSKRRQRAISYGDAGVAGERRPRHRITGGVSRRCSSQALPGTIHDPSNTTNVRSMNGASPSREYQVRPDFNEIVLVMTRCSLTDVRSNTSPPGDTNALKPVGETCTTQRPFSIARSRDDATCCDCRIVPL